MSPGKNDSFVVPTQGIKGVCQFRLRLILTTEKLHFLQEKDIAVVAIFFFESIHAAVFDGNNHLIGKLLSGEVIHANTGVTGKDMVADGVREVTFSQSRIGQQIEGATEVVVTVGYGIGCREGKTVAGAHHELVKGEPPIETVQLSVLPNRQRKG